MRFEDKVLQRVEETDYLNRENTYRYRGIIRIMYKAYEKRRYRLYRQDILKELMKFEQFEDYTDEMLKADLSVLVSCGNISDYADVTRATTPEEFINKLFLYQLSSATIEIERMLIKLENISTGAAQKSSLESTFIENFKRVLLQITEVIDKDAKAQHNWWNSLSDNFKKFSENYNDYISDFYSPKINELIQTSEFLVFKERFIIYLRNFISSIQMNAEGISNFISTVDKRLIKDILIKSSEYEAAIPQVNFVFKPDEYIELNVGIYDTMLEWFIWMDNKPPIYEQLISHTNEIIRKITRLALQILDKRNLGANRKRDYLKLIDIFSECEDISEAHKISALAFGVSGTRHIISNEHRDTDSTNSSVYDEAPRKLSVAPNVNKYKEKIKKSSIPDYTSEKELRKAEMLQKQQREEMEIKKLIKDNMIDLNDLPTISYTQRVTILSWLSKKIKENDNTFVGETDFGAKFKFREIGSNSYIKISCEDGDLYMPHYIIEIEGNDLVGES